MCTAILGYALTHTTCIGYLTHYVYCHTPLCLDTHSTVVNMHTCTILCVGEYMERIEYSEQTRHNRERAGPSGGK